MLVKGNVMTIENLNQSKIPFLIEFSPFGSPNESFHPLKILIKPLPSMACSQGLLQFGVDFTVKLNI